MKTTLKAIARASFRPCPEIVESRLFVENESGRVSSFGGACPHVPFHVETAGFVFRDARSGCTFGKRYESPEAASRAWVMGQLRSMVEFLRALRLMPAHIVREQAAYWLKDVSPVTQENPEQEQQAGAEVATGSMPPAVAFFYNESSYSHDPAAGTPAECRLRGAEAYAVAEAMACEAGCSFEWELDGGDSREWDAEGPVTPTWVCTMRSQSGTILESLSGIDFGDFEPWGQPYRRVVEAELAHEATYRRNAAELALA